MYSLHHFLFPFRWKAGMPAKDFCARLEAEGWVSRGEDWGSYDERQYFYPQMYAAVYQKGSPLVGEYVCPWRNVRYFIEKKREKQTDEQKGEGSGSRRAEILRYTLRVREGGLRIKVYDTGVALFLLEGEREAGHGANLEEVKNINDYGSRLILPYYSGAQSEEESSGGICADRLWLDSGDKVAAECDFAARNWELYRAGAVTAEESSRCLLLEGLPGLREMDIRPALDERMYVVCGVVDPQRTGEMLAWLKDPEKEGSARGKSLYEFIFKDPGGGCSCEDGDMLRRLVREHVYPRWLGQGTIYGITAQSLTALADSEFVMKHMGGLYTQMCCQALVQKASLMALQDRCVQLAREFGRDEPGSIGRMIRLRKDLSIFEGQMCFEEISSQEQPIEMYDMLRESLRLRRELENVRAQMDGLHNIASARLSTRLTWVGILLAVISTFVAVLALLP